ncbi:MAG: glycosyltransferase family 2 protein [Acidobacteriota bacterium]
MANPDLSFVVPVLDEEDSLATLCQRLLAAAESVDLTCEVIFVDDGSSDGSWAAIERLHAADDRVQALRLSRNFGHQNALWAGLSFSRGQAVVSLDADLQHPPELVPELVSRWKSGDKVVNTVRVDSGRQGLAKRATSRAFYAVFSFLTGSTLRAGMADYRLLDRTVVNELKRFHEPELFLRGLIQWMSFPSSTVEFRAPARSSGDTKYSWRRMARLAAAGLTSFSVLPLRLSIVIGFITALLAFAELVYVLLMALVYKVTVPGWASMTGILSLLIGILFVVLGVIGEYVGRTFEAVRYRPLFLVREYLGVVAPTEGGDEDATR